VVHWYTMCKKRQTANCRSYLLGVCSVVLIVGCSYGSTLIFNNSSEHVIAVYIIPFAGMSVADAMSLASEWEPSFVSASTLDTLSFRHEPPKYFRHVSIFIFDSTYASRAFERASSGPLNADSALAHYELRVEELESMKWTVRFPK
jgi:hypothetical protein